MQPLARNIAIAFLLVCAAAYAKEEKTDPALEKVWDAWLARAKKAEAKVDEALKKAPPGKSPISSQAACELTLEAAYDKFTKPESRKILRRTGMGMEGFSLLIDKMGSEAYSQVTFFYLPKSGELFGIGAVQLADGWSFISAGKNGVWLEGDGCRFIFENKDPLAPIVRLIKPEK